MLILTAAPVKNAYSKPQVGRLRLSSRALKADRFASVSRHLSQSRCCVRNCFPSRQGVSRQATLKTHSPPAAAVENVVRKVVKYWR